MILYQVNFLNGDDEIDYFGVMVMAESAEQAFVMARDDRARFHDCDWRVDDGLPADAEVWVNQYDIAITEPGVLSRTSAYRFKFADDITKEG